MLLGVIILSPNSLFDLQAHLIFANISLLLIAMLYVCQANALIDRLFFTIFVSVDFAGKPPMATSWRVFFTTLDGVRRSI